MFIGCSTNIHIYAKHAHEAIRCLTQEDGTDAIMEEIGNEYEKIYALDPEVALHAEECKRVMNLIKRTLTEVEHSALDQMPEPGEIDDVAQ